MILYDNVPINFLRDFLGYFTSHGAKSVSYHRTVITQLPVFASIFALRLFPSKKDKFSAHKFPLFASIILHGRKKDSPRRV